MMGHQFSIGRAFQRKYREVEPSLQEPEFIQPWEPVAPNFANIPKGPSCSQQRSVPLWVWKSRWSWLVRSVAEDGETCRRPVDCGSSPKAQFLGNGNSEQQIPVWSCCTYGFTVWVECWNRENTGSQSPGNLNEIAERRKWKEGRNVAGICISFNYLWVGNIFVRAKVKHFPKFICFQEFEDILV